jgi:Uma2 family endonuclease
MATTVTLTLEAFLKRPETKPASEYECGEVFRKPMPTGAHAVIQSLLSHLFLQFLRRHAIGQAGSEWRCVFGPEGGRRSYVPDFIFIGAERLPADGSWLDGPFHGAPDLAVEILSPGDRPGRVLRKVLFYLAHGVRLVWVIDPKERSITVYAPDDFDGRVLTGGDTLDGGDVLPGFSAPVDEVFPQRPAPNSAA